MLTSKVAKRYAQGLLNFTQETGNTPAILGEMSDIVKTIEKSKDLQNFLRKAIQNRGTKTNLLGKSFVKWACKK